MFGIHVFLNRWSHILSRELKIESGGWMDSFARLGRHNRIASGARVAGGVKTGDRVIFAGGAKVMGEVTIGDDTYIGMGAQICNFTGEASRIEIGKYGAIGPNVVIYGNTHDETRPSSAFLTAADTNFAWAKICGLTRIGHDVWIGANAVLMPGIHVGHGAVIGAGAVVVKDVEPYEVVVGVPARHLRFRFSEEVVRHLLELRWWDWGAERLGANRSFFTNTLKTVADLNTVQ